MRFRSTLVFSPDRIVLSFPRPPGPACDTIRRARRWGLKLLFSFEDFVLDCDRRELRRSAAIVPIEPKVFDFLTYVIQNRERVVSKDELIAAVWQGRIISDSALATCINAVRSAVADDGEQQRLLKTLARKGLRFIGNVKQDGHQPVSIPIADSRPAAPNPPLALPDKPSIAVLPFQSIGSDPEQEYFADGFVEDIISGLSRIKWLFVIARNSSFAGIAADEDAPIEKSVGDESAANPVFFRDHLVAEVGSDPEDSANRPVAIDRIELRLAMIEGIVDLPRFQAIDGDRGSAASRIERKIHPGAFPRQEFG
jgi:DNA-binding winged helix-turn-helix (wHTH) protein